MIKEKGEKYSLDALKTGGIKIAGVASSFLLSVILAKNLEPANFGEYSYIISVVLLITVPIQFGLPKLILRLVAEYKIKEQKNKISQLLGQSYIIISFTSILMILVYQIIPLGFNKELCKDWILFAIAITNTLNVLYSSLLRAYGKVISGNISDLVLKPFLFILLILSAFFLEIKINVITILKLYLTSSLLSLFFSVFYARDFILDSLKSLIETGPCWWYIKKISILLIPLLLISAVDILNSNLDIVFLGNYVEKRELGIYKVAISLSWLFSLPRSIYTLAWAPHLTSKYHESKEEFKNLVNKMSRNVFITSIFLIFLVLIFSENLITYVYGLDYKDSAIILIILSIGHFLNISLGMGDVVLNMTGHEQDVAKKSLIALILNLFLATLLIPPYGIYGASISTVISMSVWNITLFFSMKKLLLFYPNPFKSR